MSFIEHLDADNWQENFEIFFEGTLDVLEEDPRMHVGSATDDLRAWLRSGGVARVRLILTEHIANRHYSPDKQKAILDFLLVLAQKNRARLLKLAHNKVIPLAPALGDASDHVDMKNLLGRLMNGERPFEDWMYAHGHTTAEITDVYQKVDKFLFEQGFGEPTNGTRH